MLSIIAWGVEVPMILTLRNIYKCEGTLDSAVWKNKYKAEIFNLNVTDKLEDKKSNSKKVNEVDLGLGFFSFLQTYENYNYCKYYLWCPYYYIYFFINKIS